MKIFQRADLVGAPLVLGFVYSLALAACGNPYPAPPPSAASGGTPGAAAGSTAVAGTGGGPASSGGSTVIMMGAAGTSASGGTGATSAGGDSAIAGGGATATGGAGGSGGSGGTTALGGSGGGVGVAGGSGAGNCNGASFCDGFEAGLTLGAAWTVDKVAGNVVEVVTGMAHSGANAVHMKFQTNMGATFIHESMGFPAPMNSFWGRAWFYIMTPATSTGHDVYIEVADVLSTNTGVRPLNTQGGKMSINVTPGINGGEDGPQTTMALPRGAWTCFEWQITTTSGTTGSVTLYMGGMQIANQPKTKIPAIMFQRVGYEHYNADTTGGDMWIDDYAVGPMRLNCN